MNLLFEAFQWLADGHNWLGPSGILERVGQHIVFVAAVVSISTLIALPIGLYIGHTGRWKNLVMIGTGAARAVPTLGLLTLVGLWLGIGWQAPLDCSGCTCNPADYRRCIFRCDLFSRIIRCGASDWPD